MDLLRRSRTCSAALRRASSRPLQAVFSTRPASQSLSLNGGRAQQCRCYAVMQRAKIPEIARKYEAGTPISVISVTALQPVFGDEQKSHRNMTPERCLEVCLSISHLIREHHGRLSDVANASLRQKLSAEEVYEAGCILTDTGTLGMYSSDFWTIAALTGSDEAVLTTVSQLVRQGKYGKSQSYKSIEAKFRQILTKAQNPNAFALQGRILLLQRDARGAARFLERAGQMTTEPFEWRSQCELDLGKAYLLLGRGAEAQELLRKAADGGSAEADFELGKLLQQFDETQAEHHLWVAGSYGIPEAFKFLADIEVGRSLRAETEKDRLEHQRLSKEWTRLGEGREES